MNKDGAHRILITSTKDRKTRAQALTAKDIDHRCRHRGYAGSIFHYVICADGTAFPQRPRTRLAPVPGQGAVALAISLIGGLDDDKGDPCDTFTTAQTTALYHLLEAEAFAGAVIRDLLLTTQGLFSNEDCNLATYLRAIRDHGRLAAGAHPGAPPQP